VRYLTTGILILLPGTTMKKQLALLTLLLSLTALSGCQNAANVKDGPQFVSLTIEQTDPALLDGPLESSFDFAVFSHQDFEIVVETSGTNPDRFLALEINDSRSGNLKFTPTSSRYPAIAETLENENGQFVTTIRAFIPGSTGHDTYLSTRILRITNILFERDGVFGAFSATEINQDAARLLLEVHASIYFDRGLGLPTQINDGRIDISIIPGTSEYTRVKSIGNAHLVIPAFINDYPVGMIFLHDLDWVVTLTIEGATSDVFLIGKFDKLESLSVYGLDGTGQTGSRFFNLTAHCPLLTSIIIADSDNYAIYIGFNIYATNTLYRNYRLSSTDYPYTMPELVSVTVTRSNLGLLQIGRDFYTVPFVRFERLFIDRSTIGLVNFGHEENTFHWLDEIMAVDSVIDALVISGEKNALLPPATLRLQRGNYGHLFLTGSTIRYIEANGVSFSRINIRGSEKVETILFELKLKDVVITGPNNDLVIDGFLPNLRIVELENVTLGDMLIGEPSTAFLSLQTISLINVNGNFLAIGASSTYFSLLETIEIRDSNFEQQIRIGYEYSNYRILTSITIDNVTSGDIIIGILNDSFARLRLIYINDVILSGGFVLHGAFLPFIESIVFKDTTLDTLYMAQITGSYDLYLENITVNEILGLNGTDTVFVTDDPSSSWPYYDDVMALGFPVATGTYSV